MEIMIQPINLEYISEQDDPLDEWLAEREDGVLPNINFLNEATVDVDEFEPDQEGHASPPQPSLCRSATARRKGNNVATSSSQGSQRQQCGHSHEP